MPVGVQEYYLRQIYFKQLGGMSTNDIEKMCQAYSEARQTDSGIPVFGMIKALNTERKKVEASFGTSVGSDVGTAKIEYEVKQENLLKLKILNQTKLGMLILKEEASDRVRKVFRAVISAIKVTIKHSASRLHGSLDLTQRDIEKILTEEYNNSIKELEHGAKVISWEEDGSSNLLKTRLADIESEDPIFADAVKRKQREHGYDGKN